MALIVPSLLAGDFARLGESLEVVQALGVPTVHIDVMDGHFRPQISAGQPVIRSIRRATNLKLEIHLLIERPERYLEDFVKAGADSLAFHIEASENLALAINTARKLRIRAGVALNATTPVETCFEVLEDIDFVLVEAAAETLKPRSLHRVAALAKERKARGLNFVIEAEGDFDAGEAEQLFLASADILVVGSAIFDKEERGEAMRVLAWTLSGDSAAFAQETKYGVH
jgi:ribulose-phosphate 3-epimerase